MPWSTSTIRSRGAASAVRSSWGKWSTMQTRIGSAISGAPREFSSDLPNSLGSGEEGTRCMASQQGRSEILALILLAALSACGPRVWARESRQLPTLIVRDLCAKFDGKPAFDSKGQRTTIDCDLVQKVSIISRPTLIETYRQILDQAATLAELRSANVSPDLDCGHFEVQDVTGNHVIVCRSDLGEMVPSVFVADSSDRILRLETVLDYRAIFREAMHRSVVRGRISAYFEPYIELNTDVMIAKLRFTASPLDSVTIENGKISIVMKASR